MTDNRIRTVVVVKEGERYVFRFTNATRKALLIALARHAKNPELSFTWRDATEVVHATTLPGPSAGNVRGAVVGRRTLFPRRFQNQ